MRRRNTFSFVSFVDGHMRKNKIGFDQRSKDLMSFPGRYDFATSIPPLISRLFVENGVKRGDFGVLLHHKWCVCLPSCPKEGGQRMVAKWRQFFSTGESS